MSLSVVSLLSQSSHRIGSPLDDEGGNDDRSIALTVAAEREGEEIALCQCPLGLAVVASDRASASGESEFGEDEGDAIASGLGLVTGMVRHANRVGREGFAEEGEGGVGRPLHGMRLWTELS